MILALTRGQEGFSRFIGLVKDTTNPWRENKYLLYSPDTSPASNQQYQGIKGIAVGPHTKQTSTKQNILDDYSTVNIQTHDINAVASV